MKASVYVHNTSAGGVSEHIMAIAEGLQRHGVAVSYFHGFPEPDADFAVCWGWRKGDRIRQNGFTKPILVAERAYLPDRFEWTSLGWDGLNGRARWPQAQDNGQRFWRNWGAYARAWEEFDGYYLVIGQVLGDAALTMVDFTKWVRETIEGLQRLDVDVRFRAHPEALKRGQTFGVPDHLVIGGDLQDNLAGAAAVVTWNSNTGVDAVLAGVPTVTSDIGAMAWPVTSHSIFEPLVMPDRNEWFRDMAWRQFTMNEIRSGFAWEIVSTAM